MQFGPRWEATGGNREQRDPERQTEKEFIKQSRSKSLSELKRFKVDNEKIDHCGHCQCMKLYNRSKVVSSNTRDKLSYSVSGEVLSKEN